MIVDAHLHVDAIPALGWNLEAAECVRRLDEAGIDPDYFLDAPNEPDEKGLIAARQTLARLLDLSVPGDDLDPSRHSDG